MINNLIKTKIKHIIVITNYQQLIIILHYYEYIL